MNDFSITPQRILLINVSRIGDTLLITPVIRAIAAHWPNAKLEVLAHHERGIVLENLPEISRLAHISKSSAPFRGRCPGKPYDLAFVYNFDEALVKYALRVARHVVAFEQADSDINRRLFRSVKHPGNRNGHLVETNLMLPALLDIPPAGKRLHYAVSPTEAAWAKEFLRAHIHTGQPLIGLQVASFHTKAFRDWPIGHFETLCQRIMERWPCTHFLLLGGNDEKAKVSQLAKQLGVHATVCAGQLSLRQSAALMAQLDLYIGVDTGPTHLMGAFQKPMVILYHGYLPSRIARPLEHPYAHVVDHPRAEHCETDASMAEISVDRVWQEVISALEWGKQA